MDRPRPGKRRHRLIAVATLSVAVTAAIAPAAANAAVATTRDLTTPGTLRIAGSSANPIGSRVALLGDVNGDGIGDLATSGQYDPNQGDIGRVEVVFGRTSSGRIETDPLPAGGGFQITGVAFNLGSPASFNLSSYRPGPSVAAAGDVNGDGLADIIVGASGFRLSDTQQGSGRAFVIFGSNSPTGVDVRALPEMRGYALVPPTSYSSFGWQVAGVGDVNRDGLADVAVSSQSGAAPFFEEHVVYGRRSGGTIDLGQWTPAMGFRVSGHVTAADGWVTPLAGTSLNSLGYAVTGLGDINGDGFDDLAIGSPIDGPDNGGFMPFFGAVYVVYGGRTTDLSTADLGCSRCARNGIRITGDQVALGTVVRGPGDVNGDQIPDILIGDEEGNAGAYVVFGRGKNPAAINLQKNFTGFVIKSLTAQPGDPCCHPGDRVAPAGDVNHDGLADLLVGNGADSPTVDGVRRDLGGQAYVIYGRNATSTVDVDNLAASAGFRIVGGVFLDGVATGYGLDGGRDMTGDGRPDLAIGSSLLPGDPTADVSGIDVLAQ
jgi:hypothetical protein